MAGLFWHKPANVTARRLTRAVRRPAAIAMVAGMVVAACGLRVDHSTVRAANQAALSAGGGGTGGLAAGSQSGGENGTVGGGGSVGGANPASGSGSGGSSGSGSQVSGGAAGAGGTTNAGAPAPAGGNGGATDVGVTGNQILVGNVSDLGGPVPGLFQGGPYGTNAYFNYVNSQGGVFGRQLKLVSDDDQLQCSQNEADYQDLVSKVFAFVGSWSLDDNCGATVLSQYPKIANVSQALSVQAQALPGAINVSPYGAGAALGPYLYYKNLNQADITKSGTLVGNQASAKQSWEYQKAAAESAGFKFIYEDDFPPAQSNFTADVVRMRQQGVQVVYIIAVNAPDLADFAAECEQQGWHPKLFASGIGYFGAYVQESGGPSAVEGQYVNAANAMFLGEDAGTIPEVALFDKWMKASYPNFPLDQFSANSWANAAMFVEALKAAGPKLTRDGLLAALKTMHTFNDHGMTPPADPANKKPSNCYLELKLHDGKYTRVDDPPGAFRCDAPYHYA